MSYKINLEGFDKLQGRLRNLDGTLKTEVKQEIKKSAVTIQTEAKILAPKNYGFLSNSISNRDLEDGAEIDVSADYAAYVEFGTGAEVQIPAGLEQYARQFYVNGKGHLPAQPFLFPAFFDEKPKLVERIIKKLGK